MKELALDGIRVTSFCDMAMLEAYRLTCEACARHGRFNSKPMGEEEWWATMRDNFAKVLKIYKNYDVWKHSEG